MPKAIYITEDNLSLVSGLSGWEKDPQVIGYYYVQDVQFPHGYVKEAIITRETFEATFKLTTSVGQDRMYEVDYK